MEVPFDIALYNQLVRVIEAEAKNQIRDAYSYLHPAVRAAVPLTTFEKEWQRTFVRADRVDQSIDVTAFEPTEIESEVLGRRLPGYAVTVENASTSATYYFATDRTTEQFYQVW